jgi:hypothetical protein
MGNWQAPTTQYHEPIRRKGFHKLLQCFGFQVHLIDEFRTNRCYPDYGSMNLKICRIVQALTPTDGKKILVLFDMVY